MRFLLAALLLLLPFLADADPSRRRLLIGRGAPTGGGGGCPSGLLVSLKADNNLTDSGNGNTFSAPSQPANYTNGIVNQGFWFNSGYDSHIEANDQADLSMGGAAKSWSWFVYPTSSANDFIGMVAKGTFGGGDEEYWCYIDSSDKVVFHLYDSGGTPQSVTSTPTLSINTWYHIVVTYDSTDLKLYVSTGGTPDPSPDTVSATSSRNNSTKFWMGTAHNSGSMFTGIIDEFQMYSTALTSSDVAALYNSGNGKQCP